MLSTAGYTLPVLGRISCFGHHFNSQNGLFPNLGNKHLMNGKHTTASQGQNTHFQEHGPDLI